MVQHYLLYGKKAEEDTEKLNSESQMTQYPSTILDEKSFNEEFKPL
jgi:hypothetical protein